MRRVLVALLLSLVFAVGLPRASAAETTAKEGEPGTNVEMPFLIAPMSKDGKLLGYAYISSKLVASSQGAAIGVRDKLAFIQDAFVRDVNGAPISKTDDPLAVDPDLLNRRLIADARRIVGANKVVRMLFTAVQFAPLHPGNSTDNLVAPTDKAPGTGDAAAATTSGETKTPESAQSPATSKPAPESTH